MRPSPKAVERSFHEALMAAGIRLKYGVGTIPITQDFLGWVGLNIGVHGSFIRVNPNVGVHCIPIMKLVDAAIGKRYRSGEFPTISYPLGEACPEVPQFIIQHDDDILPQAKRLADTLKQFGVPFIKSLADYSSLTTRLKSRVHNLGGVPERYAAALYLSGDIQSAFDFISEQAAQFLSEGYTNEAEKLKKIGVVLKLQSKDDQSGNA